MFEPAFRNIDDVLSKEADCTTELDYTEQTSWLPFFKYLDGLAQEPGRRGGAVGQEITKDRVTGARNRTSLGHALATATGWDAPRGLLSERDRRATLGAYRSRNGPEARSCHSANYNPQAVERWLFHANAVKVRAARTICIRECPGMARFE